MEVSGQLHVPASIPKGDVLLMSGHRKKRPGASVDAMERPVLIMYIL
jgi:hypothetical protein